MPHSIALYMYQLGAKGQMAPVNTSEARDRRLFWRRGDKGVKKISKEQSHIACKHMNQPALIRSTLGKALERMKTVFQNHVERTEQTRKVAEGSNDVAQRCHVPQ